MLHCTLDTSPGQDFFPVFNQEVAKTGPRLTDSSRKGAKNAKEALEALKCYEGYSLATLAPLRETLC